jgi:formamidopyrimidine-DNA glycosylase
MPELPEVQTVVDSLNPILPGKRMTDIQLFRRDIVTPPDVDLVAKLKNRVVVSVERRAKRIIVLLDSNERFYIHLGMSGRLMIEQADAPVLKHTHLIVILDDGAQLRFRDPRRFGGIWWLGKEMGDEQLGPEPLQVSSKQLAKRLGATKRVIKSALLDQKLIAGLGNIYVDESLFQAGIHPQTRADKLSGSQIKALTRAIKQILRRALHHKGSTLRDFVDANGSAGDYRKKHRVYDREDEPCVTCKTPIKRIVITGRSTHFCSNCQPRKGARRR